MLYIGLYLVAIIAANLSAAAFGPGASILNAFLLVGLDLTARDRLHEAWHGRLLRLKMLVLILGGSVLTWMLSRNAGTVAQASAISFALAGVADAVIYGVLGKRARWQRVNGSNAVSGLVDSLVFPTLAFGGFSLVITLGQWLAKLAGGYIWSWVVFRDLPKRLRQAQLSKV